MPCEVDGGAREGTADAAAPEARADGEAGHGPDAVIGLVPRSARPGDATEAHVGGARLDRAPADGLAVEVGDEAARRTRLGVTAARLLAQLVDAFLDGNRVRVPPPCPGS